MKSLFTSFKFCPLVPDMPIPVCHYAERKMKGEVNIGTIPVNISEKLEESWRNQQDKMEVHKSLWERKTFVNLKEELGNV